MLYEVITPAALRSAIGSAEPYVVPVFGVDLCVWPKWSYNFV